VAALLHDAGLASTIAGEDFTIRSAKLARDVCARAGARGASAEALADAIVAHITPGITATDSPLGFYVQAGALLDLAGVRMRQLSPEFLKDIYARHPQEGMRTSIVQSLAREGAAVPRGRVTLLNRAGFGLSIRLSPTRNF